MALRAKKGKFKRMNKLYNLKQAILAMPLKIDASNLFVKATGGKIGATKPAGNTSLKNENFFIDYDAEILITDFCENQHLLFALLLNWIFENVQTYENGDLEYEADILDNSSADLYIKIKGVREIVKIVNNQLNIIQDENLEPILGDTLKVSSIKVQSNGESGQVGG